MSAIEKAVAHYDQFTGASRPFIDVPEWGDPDKPLRIYWKPLTLRQHGKIFKSDKPLDDRLFADIVAMKAEDEKGDPMFDPFTDVPKLRDHADRVVVSRIAIAMLKAPELKDLEKN